MAEQPTEPKDQALSPSEKEKRSASNPPSPSQYTHRQARHASHSHLSERRATVLFYCLTATLLLFLAGSVLNSIGLFPPAIVAATSAFGGTLAAVLGALGGLLVGSLLQQGFKEVWLKAKRLWAIVAAILTVSILTGSTLLAVYLTSDPYTHSFRYGYSKLVIDDPLRDNSRGNGWSEGNICTFSNGAYQAATETRNHFSWCTAESTNFRNFVYEVQMTIVTGDCGGILFRYDSAHPSAYVFWVCSNGSYSLRRFESGTSNNGSTSLSNGHILSKATSASSIHTGLNRPNLITVVVSSEAIELWSNRQLLADIPESILKQGGHIGVLTREDTQPTKVTFRNAKVWTLP